MGKGTGIEWTDATWNPIRGCSRVSEGCRNCYAEQVAARFSGKGQAYEHLATFKVLNAGLESERVEARWTGEVAFVEKHLRDPLTWKEPMRVFVNSMSDLFHPGVRAEWLAEIFEVMAKAPQHTYQILTKRPERMFEALEAGGAPDVAEAFEQTYGQPWPPQNWIFGVSIEDQETANHRLPILARCRCKQRMVSYEPAIGPVNLHEAFDDDASIATIDWMIVGGESGPRARPMHPQWARDIRSTCEVVGIPFFFKQWGEWVQWEPKFPARGVKHIRSSDGAQFDHPVQAGASNEPMVKVGKHASGSALDGIEWKEFPNVERVAVA